MAETMKAGGAVEFSSYKFGRTDGAGREITLAGRAIGPGDGRQVVMLASLGRPGSDFDEVAAMLAGAGCHVTLPEPRGIGGSEGPMEGLTLHDLAEDVVAVIETQTTAPVTLLGHAFGNRLARTTAADRPELVSRVALLACGGLIEMPEKARKALIGHAFGNRLARTTAADRPELVARVGLLACGGLIEMPEKARKALIGCFDESLSPDEHIECVRYGFFAKGNDPEVWRGGWYRQVMRMQSFAVRTTPVEDWWEAGGQPILVVQALEDAIALPANAQDLKKRLGARATLVELPNAGHAMLPEQPARIAEIVRNYIEAAEQAHGTEDHPL